MTNHHEHELPIRSKLKILDHVVEILICLHEGNRDRGDHLIEELKLLAMPLDEPIQQDILIFSEQVDFQHGYDPWHKITPEVQRAADRLIERIGFPSFYSKRQS